MKSFLAFVDSIDRWHRLLFSFALGLLIFFTTKRPGNEGLHFLYAWIGFASTFLFFSWVTILVRHPRNIGRIAKEQDASFWIIFFIVISTSVISLFIVLFLLQELPKYSQSRLSLHIVLSMTAVLLSWTLIHTLFTIRYAHLYYDASSRRAKEADPQVGGLVFPGNEPPGFLDFAYFSFVIGMTFQVSDVNITNANFRRLALLHGLLSFVFNTAIIALTINIVSGLLGNR